MGLGLTNWWSIFVAGGAQVTRSGGGWNAGYINGIGILGPFEASEGTKIRVGTKFNFHSEVDQDFRIAGWLAAHIPVGDPAVQSGTGDQIDAVNSPRTDWEWGAAVSKSWFTGLISYTMSGEQDNDVRVPNLLRFGFGAAIPVTNIIQVIAETYYNVLDGGDNPEPDYAMLNGGARIWFGQTGWALSAAFSSNLTMLVNHGVNPNPFGGILGITYAAWPPEPPPPVVVPAPEPVVEPAPVAAAPVVTPAPAPASPASGAAFDDRRDLLRRQERPADQHREGRSGRRGAADEERPQRDRGRHGLHGQHGHRQGQPGAGPQARQAAKHYLVTRHGIDPSRITTVSKGAADPAYDNATAEGKTKNRRAQIVVTLVSGT